MNGQFLYEAMGGIGQDLVAEAEHRVFRKSSWRKLAELAACVTVLIGLTMALTRILPGGSTPLSAWSHPTQMTAGDDYSPKTVCLYGLAMLLTLGAWGVPVWACRRRKPREHREWLSVLSALLGLLALLAQLWGLLTQMQLQQWRLLERSAQGHLIAAVVILLGTVAVNIVLCLTGKGEDA